MRDGEGQTGNERERFMQAEIRTSSLFQVRAMQTAFSAARSPKDDDLTPPELRGGGGSAHFVQPGAGGGSSTGSSSPDEGDSRKGRRSSKQEVRNRLAFFMSRNSLINRS